MLVGKRKALISCYCTADLHLLFSRMQKSCFHMMQLNIYAGFDCNVFIRKLSQTIGLRIAQVPGNRKENFKCSKSLEMLCSIANCDLSIHCCNPWLTRKKKIKN